MDATADSLVVFGITGDLGRRMTLPALYRLEVRGALPCDVIGVGRSERTTEQIRVFAREAVERAEPAIDPDALGRFAARLSYVTGDSEDPELYGRLRKALGSARRPVFYLATPPSLFASIVRRLAAEGLTRDARVVIEKPFGHDLPSARGLNRMLREVLDEGQIYRIDHFLGKEPVQDIVYLRFANEVFEPIWNRHHVESVQITLAEAFDVAERGSFYDGVGALRDVVQNHLLHVLALIAMEAPAGGQDAIADRVLDVLRVVRDADPREYVRGQYAGYREVEGVRPGSDTETFAALRLSLDNWRWSGVPFLIRAGKALPDTSTEVHVVFRQPPPILVGHRWAEVRHRNHISIRIGHDAGASIGVFVKSPSDDSAEPVHLNVSFAEHVGRSPQPYERLLSDALRGDPALFPRQDVVEEMWRIVQPLLEGGPPVETYEPGTWGPDAAERLAGGSGGWRTPVAGTDEGSEQA